MLKELHLKFVGPASQFDVEFADRLNIFTGDNGLGKSFLLDVAWWVLTRKWADQPAYPQKSTEETPKIISQITTEKDINDYESYFDFSDQQWESADNFSKLKELVIFVRVDGGFSVFDPIRKRNAMIHFGLVG